MLLMLIAIVWVLIWVLGLVDIVRRRDLRASSKVLWALAVIFVPVVGVLVYLVARPGDATHYVPPDSYAVPANGAYEIVRDRHPV